jgi:UDP-N-acetylmuramyl tripeptide synthase
MENYLEAKLQLFRENLEERGEVVINSEILASSYGDGVKNFFAKLAI